MTNGTCHGCHHGYEKHMHITYDITRVMVDVIDQNVQSDLKTTEDRIQATQSAISQCEGRKKEYEREQRIITKTAAKFAVFLKENSITPYNNAIIRYLDYMIELEEEKVHHGGVRTTGEQLKKLRGVYVAEEKILLEAMKVSDGGNISLEDIQHSLDALYSLPLTGQTIQNLLLTATGAEKFCYTEKACNPKGKQQGGQGLYAKMSSMEIKAKEKLGY